MELIVLQENLKKALSIVARGVSPKSQLPVLSNIYLEATQGHLTLASTNLETSVSFTIGAQVEEIGALTIPARFLSELVGSFTHDKVSIKTEKTHMKLVCGTSEATLTGIDAGEFPPLPKTEKQADATLNKDLIERGLPFVLIASSADEGRPILTGVKFLESEDKLLLVATDGFRLSIKELPKQVGLGEGFVVPAKTLSEVFRLSSDESQKNVGVHFSKDKNQIIFTLENGFIATRLLEGEYPPFRKIIPNGFATRAVIDVQSFLQGVKFASVFARESANIIKLKVGGDALVLSANTPQIGENKTTVSASIEGEGGEIAFNARFLLDLLQVFPEEEIVFEMNGPLAPGVFKAKIDTSLIHIIMPVRLQG